MDALGLCNFTPCHVKIQEHCFVSTAPFFWEPDGPIKVAFKKTGFAMQSKLGIVQENP